MRRRTSGQVFLEFVIMLAMAVVLTLAVLVVFRAMERSGTRDFELVRMELP